jgi:hypothetical protein
LETGEPQPGIRKLSARRRPLVAPNVQLELGDQSQTTQTLEYDFDADIKDVAYVTGGT